MIRQELGCLDECGVEIGLIMSYGLSRSLSIAALRRILLNMTMPTRICRLVVCVVDPASLSNLINSLKINSYHIPSP